MALSIDSVAALQNNSSSTNDFLSTYFFHEYRSCFLLSLTACCLADVYRIVEYSTLDSLVQEQNKNTSNFSQTSWFVTISLVNV